MSRPLIAGLAVLTLTACAPAVPDSNPRGAGFGGPEAFAARREAELAGRIAPSAGPEARTIGAETIAVLNATGADLGRPPVPQPIPQTTVVVPVQPERSFPAANPNVAGERVPTGTIPAVAVAVPRDTTGISDEQDFAAVSSRETIESDRQRLEQLAAQRQVIQPTALPSRPSDTGPNVVAFALNTSNAVGQQLYRRVGLNKEARFRRVCAGFPSQDKAQAEFLSDGGPERDPRGMDPDGDGFACYWDPSPYRAARN